jgi:signal peptide peptidase SppA
MYGTPMDNLLTDLVNRPALVAPRAMPSLLASIRSATANDEQEGRFSASLLSEQAERRGGYYLDEGVAVIPVMGPTAHRSWWRTSYEGLSRTHDAAQNDPQVKAIAWLFDTPGGMVSGVFDFADELYQARGNKPAVAVVSEMAASAGYLLASAVGEIIVPRTGEVGSVGVVMQHWDFSAALEEMGVSQTYIYAGDHKVDGNPYQPLPKDVKARFKDELVYVYGMFVDAVTRNRGMQREAVIGTQALTYIGEKAVEVGFADRVEPTRDTLARLKKDHGTGSGLWSMTHQPTGGTMGKQTEAPDNAGTTTTAASGSETETAQAEAQATEVVAQAAAGADTDTDIGGGSSGAPAAADPAQVISMAQAAGLGQYAADWVSQGLTLEQVQGNITFATDVRDKCAAANIDPAPILATGGDVSQLASMVITYAAAAGGGEHIDNGVVAQSGDDKDKGWGKAFGATKKAKF